MKRIILSLLVALVALAPQSASAFSFDWGFTGGYNLSKVKFSKNDYKENFSSGNRSGWYLGPKIHLGLIAGFCIDASATYSQRNLEIDGESNMLHSFEIPVNLKYSLGLGKQASVFVTTGPQFGFAIGDSEWNLGNVDNQLQQTFKRNNMQTSWNVGAGVRLFKHFEVGVGYNFAITKFGETLIKETTGLEAIEASANSRANTFHAQVTYYF